MRVEIYGTFLLSGDVRPLNPALRDLVHRRLAPVAARVAPAGVRVMLAERIGPACNIEFACRVQLLGAAPYATEFQHANLNEALLRAIGDFKPTSRCTLFPRTRQHAAPRIQHVNPCW